MRPKMYSICFWLNLISLQIFYLQSYLGTSCQNSITNRDKFLNQIRFCIFCFATGAKGKYNRRDRFIWNHLSKSNQFYGIRPSPETGHHCAPKQTIQYLVLAQTQSIDVATSGVKYFYVLKLLCLLVIERINNYKFN